MEVILRKAHGLDIAKLGRLLLAWLEESDFNYPGYCDYTPVWLANFMYNNIVTIAEVDGKIAGSLGLRYGHFPWNNEAKAFFCEFLMVDKDYRSFDIAKSLVSNAKLLSDECNIPVFLGIMTGNLADKKDRFLEICGFKYAGGNFVYGV